MEKVKLSPRARTSYVLRLVTLAALLLLAIAAAAPMIPPAAVAAGAPPTRFSAEQAKADLAVIAAEPHGAGSEAQHRVRDYIVKEAANLGLNVDVEASGSIENIIVHIPGSDSTGQVIISGHYDSAPLSPGAGDDGISAAAMLETIRTLQNDYVLRNNIDFLFTDGEEMGWKGASAYVAAHPKANQNSVMLMFDARPGNGVLMLRSTSAGDAWVIKQVAAARPTLYAGSWIRADERTDTDTDFSGVFMPAGYVGVEIENEANGTLYHTAGDTADKVRPRTMQAFGESMLRLANRFGSVDLTQARPGRDVTYFSVPLVGIIYYPGWLTPALAILSVASLVGLAVWGGLTRRLSIPRSLVGMVLLLVGFVAIALLGSAAWSWLLDTQPVTRDATLGYPDFPGATWWMVIIMAAAYALDLVVIILLSRRINAASLSLGGLLVYALVWVVAFLFLDSDNPLTSPTIVWPFLGGVAMLKIALLKRPFSLRAVLLLLAVIPVLVLVVPMLIPEIMQPDEGAWIYILVVALVSGIISPLLLLILRPKALEH